MNKFKVRHLHTFETLVDADSAEQAVAIVSAKGGVSTRILGAVPADQEWPGEEKEVVVRPPPRGRPNGGGSPGTPTLPREPDQLSAVAA